MTPLSQKRVAMGKKHSITQEIREEKLDDTPPEKKSMMSTLDKAEMERSS